MPTLLSGYDQLITLAEWQALPEDPEHSYELVEGVIRVVPRPMIQHQRIIWALTTLLNAKMPRHLFALPEVEATIDDQDPATVRVPDIVVTQTEIAEANPVRLHAADVGLVVEVHSPGTRRIDRVLKVAEYAQAGIPSYWLVDCDRAPSVTVLSLRGDHYEEVASTSGTLTVEHPAPLQIEVADLIRFG